jgi:hypothetical protein
MDEEEERQINRARVAEAAYLLDQVAEREEKQKAYRAVERLFAYRVSAVMSHDGMTLVWLCNEVTAAPLEDGGGYSVQMADGFAVGHAAGGTGRPNVVKTVRAVCLWYAIEEVAAAPDFGPEDVTARSAGPG